MSNCLTIIWQKLEDSFSAVLKPNFATKYLWKALDEIYQSCIPLRLSDLKKINNFSSRISMMFSPFFKKHRQHFAMFAAISSEAWPKFVGISQIIQKIAKNKWKEFDLNLIWVGCGLNNVRQLGHKSVSTTQSYTTLNLHAIKHQTQ